MSISHEGAGPPNNDVRQLQRDYIEDENVMVDMVKGLGEVNEDSAYRLASVNSSMPVM